MIQMTKIFFAIILLSLSLNVVWADGGLESIPWGQLSESEQNILARFESKWDGFSARRQNKLQNGAQRWEKMTDTERARFKIRFAHWKTLTPETRRGIKKRYLRFRKLPPKKQAAIRASHRWFRGLEPEQRKEFRKRWETMDRNDKKKFLKEHWGREGRPRIPQYLRRQHSDSLP